MRFMILAAFVGLLAGCASTPTGDLGAARNSWQGATYDDVVRTWGAPVRSTRLSDGRDVYTWVSETVTSQPAFFPSLGIFGGGHGGVGFGTGVTMGSGGGGELARCERTFIFQNGRVVEQTWNGPAGYCGSFGRG